MKWASGVILAVQLVALVLGWRAMYRNYGKGPADHGYLRPPITLLLLTIAAQQIIQVMKYPSETFGWVALGISIVCSVVLAVSTVRRRHSTATH